MVSAAVEAADDAFPILPSSTTRSVHSFAHLDLRSLRPTSESRFWRQTQSTLLMLNDVAGRPRASKSPRRCSTTWLRVSTCGARSACDVTKPSTWSTTGWDIEVRRAPVGVVGFVFEGRPNVFADAAGGYVQGTRQFCESALMLGTAAMMASAVVPALTAAGLPTSSIVLIESRAHAAGWALFADRRLALAVARGSGPAVDQPGALLALLARR